MKRLLLILALLIALPASAQQWTLSPGGTEPITRLQPSAGGFFGGGGRLTAWYQTSAATDTVVLDTSACKTVDFYMDDDIASAATGSGIKLIIMESLTQCAGGETSSALNSKQWCRDGNGGGVDCTSNNSELDGTNGDGLNQKWNILGIPGGCHWLDLTAAPGPTGVAKAVCRP